MIKPALALQIQKCFFFFKFQSNYITIALQFIPISFLPNHQFSIFLNMNQFKKKPEKYIISHQDLLMLTICNTNARALWNSRNRQKTCTQLSQNIPTNDRGNPNFYAQSITILKHCMMSLAPENSLWLSCVGICGGQTGRV